MKKVICLIISFAVLFSLTSCSLLGDMSKLENDEDGNLVYSENTYHYQNLDFTVNTNDEVVELGWYSQFPFFPDMHYYAFEENAPMFIFCENHESSSYTKGLYVIEDFDLFGAIFIIKETNIEISLDSAISLSNIDVSEINTEEDYFVYMCLKDDPRIQVDFCGPYEHNGKFYFVQSGKAWVLSDEFTEMLISSGIIDNE